LAIKGVKSGSVSKCPCCVKEIFPKDNLPLGLLYKVVTPGAGITLPA